MVGEKKHRSFKDLLRNSSAPLLIHVQHSPTDQPSVPSHRFFLRKRNSRSSVTSSSASSVASGNDATALSMAPSESTRSEDSSQLTGSVHEKRGNHKKEKKDRKKVLLGNHHHSHHSHHSLKRFFKILHPNDHGSGNHNAPVPVLPLSKTSDLAKKYDLGKLIGAGASGSVNLVNDKNDMNKIYAVKKFRPKLKGETEHDYMTKVKNEFLIGDYLRHQNLIHTMELIQDQVPAADGAEYYIVMEYCPYDFFNLVMSGLMTKEEIYCYTKQIINGVHHLHKAGVAHRDLKLDNCVVDANGVLKLIDFGSAFQFKKQIDHTKPRTQQVLLDENHRLVPAKGIVGLDPYLSPEVFESVNTDGYDARLADIWSIAIIFCCMLLKRFPWKVPRTADPSYRAFAGLNNQDEPVTEQEKLSLSMNDVSISKDQLPKYGPDRLLRMLPSRSRPLVRGMLEIDVTKRYYIEDVVQDHFYLLIEHCHYLDEESDEKLRSEGEKLESEEQKLESEEQKLEGGENKLEGEGIRTGGEKLENGEVPSGANLLAPTEATAAGSEDNLDKDDNATLATTESTLPLDVSVHTRGKFIRALNHTHHLVTEKELERLNAEKDKARKLKESGVA